MALHIIDERKNLPSPLQPKLDLMDPFIKGEPCWRTRVGLMLPGVEFAPTGANKMPVKIIAENSVPTRQFARFGTTGSPEFLETIAAMNKLPQGQALVIDIESPDLKKVKKPSNALAVALRRFFKDEGIMADAYQSTEHQVVVRRVKAEVNHGTSKSKK